MNAVKFIEARPWLMRALKPVSEWYVSAAGWRRLGLRYDDLMEEENEAAQIAIKRLTAAQSAERTFRLRRAMQCSITHKLLPENEWTKPEEDVPYISPIIEQVKAEMAEKAALDTLTVMPRHNKH